MCMIEDGERYAVYHQDTVKARKPHKCNECGREIAKGETYRRTAGLYDGSWTINKVCAHCTVAAEWLLTNCGGYMDSVVHEDIVQHVDEYRRMDLARLAVGMKRDWKRFDGAGLLPVPKLPRPIQLGDAR